MQTLWQRMLNLRTAADDGFIKPWTADLYREAATLGLQLKKPFNSPCAASISIADFAFDWPQSLPPKCAPLATC